MNRARRKSRLVLGLTLFVIPVALFHACMPKFRMSSKEITSYFASHRVKGEQHHYNFKWRDVHYVAAGDSTKPLVLFVHGSPGSLSAFIHFLVDTTLIQQNLLVSADRPGFGYSNFGTAEPSLDEQAASLKPILERYQRNRPRILVGHSLGGPLIAKMAMDYPDLVDGLIIVAGSIDPELEPNETWFRAPLATPFLSWILPKSMRASNEEIYQLKPQLETMMERWKDIQCPVMVIQGKKDFLVPYENALFAERMLVNAPVELVVDDSMNHFVPWSHPHLIKNAIIKMTQGQITSIR